MVEDVYRKELLLNKPNTSNTEAPFLDLNLSISNLSISNVIISTKIHDKRDDFDFGIVKLPLLDGNDPRATCYGVYISHIIRFATASSHVLPRKTTF